MRSTPSSRNSPAAGLVAPFLSVNDQGTVIDVLFTVARVVPTGALTATRLPELSFPDHRNTLTADVEPAIVKVLTSSRSPSFVVTFGFMAIVFFRNQKLTMAVALRSNRSMPA